MPIKLSVTLPLVGIGGDSKLSKEFSQLAEEVSYDCFALPGHILGTNIENKSDWGNRNTSVDFCCEPLFYSVFLSACASIIEFFSQVVEFSQRQTVVVAKGTSSLDVLSIERLV